MIRDLGVLLNCSQTGGILTVENVKRFADFLVRMGYQSLMLYTEDVYEIEGEPYFGYLRGRYRKEEIREIDAYCSSIGLELIPCIETLGHLEKVLQWNAYSPIRNAEDTVDVDAEATYVLIEKMIKECRECFSSHYINLGMDEADSMFMGQFLKRHGWLSKEEKFQVLLRHVEKVANLAKRYDFVPYMWSDMWFKIARGQYYALTDDVPLKVKERFAKTGMNLIYWDYFEDNAMYDSMLEQHRDFGCDVAFAGGACNWIGFATSNFHSIAKNKMGVSSCLKAGVERYLVTLWGGVYSDFYAVLPTLFAVSEYRKGNFDENSIRQKFETTFQESWDDFCLFDLLLPKEIRVTDDITSGGMEYFFADPFLSAYDSTIRDDEKEVAVYRDYVEKFLEAAKRSHHFSPLFQKAAAYVNALADKYALGIHTRRAYLSRDRKKLAKILPEFDKAICSFETFYQQFRSYFFSEMKGEGFNSYDLRLGGVLSRLKTCRWRLEQYLEGKIERIEELEEPILDYYGGDQFEKRIVLDCSSFRRMTTVNDL